FSFQLMGTLIPVDAAIDLNRAIDCAEMAIKGTAAAALIVVPSYRSARKCMDFKAAKTANLDGNDILKLAYDFFIKLSGSSKCIINLANDFNKILVPYVAKINDLKCV
ncbi:hypothetical protein KR018_008213, partial [Drosophila ironensis]